MRNISVLRSGAALEVVGLLAGCSGAAAPSSTNSPAASAATYSAEDIEAIVAEVDETLSLGGTLLGAAEMKAASDTAAGLSALTKAVPSDATIEPAACADIRKNGLDDIGSQPELDTTAMVQFGTRSLTVGTVAGKALPSGIADGMPASVRKLLDTCSTMTISSGAISMQLKLSTFEVKTAADSAWGLKMSFGGSGAEATMTAVSAVSGNLAITATTVDTSIPGATSTDAPTVTPAELIDAVVAAAD